MANYQCSCAGARTGELFPETDTRTVCISSFARTMTTRGQLIGLTWETEAWCADSPDHMVHLDGTRFLGPYAE